MANGRKGQKAAATAPSGGGTSAGARRRWPKDDEEGDDAGPPGSDDLVTIVRGLAAAVAEHNLSELIVDTPEVTFTLRRGATGAVVPVAMPPMAMPASMPMPPTMPTGMAAHFGHGATHAAAIAAAAPAYDAAAVEDKSHVVTSPFVGTFYRKPNPDSPDYVKLGDKVRKGQVLCIVEAMKLMNEIEADLEGTISGILAEDGAPVEYGQPLFKIA